jgi:membrane protein DedA with SNARE-associated domain
VRFYIFILGALVAGVGWIGMYAGLSYFLGEEVANRIGNIATKAVLAVVALVVVGLLVRTGVPMWRANRQNRLAEQDAR